MRKWHRWLAVLFGIFLLWIAVTGILSHVAALWPSDAPRAQPPAGFVCPDTMICRPKPTDTGIKSLTGWFHHLHSGEEFGPIGTAIAVLSGFAMVFFSISGLWLYLSMWSNRKNRGINPRWFWK